MPRTKFHVSILLALVMSVVQSQNVDPGEPLFLTPLIEAGELNQAHEAALVTKFNPVVSYSGFITVNAEYNSNIFFWFFPAEESYGDGDVHNNDIPVLLWNDGGPGFSCAFSIFGVNGPFIGNPDGVHYNPNPISWHKKFHMIYIDNPVEVGYSFTDKEEGYVTSGPEAAEGIYEFLIQFFKMFPQYQKNPFYNAGVSYGATYAIQVAHTIHERNQDNPKVNINLTGLIVDSPYIDPLTQSYYADPLYSFGVIGEPDKDKMIQKEKEIESLLGQEKYEEATGIWLELNHLVPTLTGYTALGDVYADLQKLTNMTELITLNSTRKALHVGNSNYIFLSTEQQTRMHPNFMRSSKDRLDSLLKGGYRFMLYVGNMDILTGHLGIERMFKTMEWEGISSLLNGTRTIRKLDEKVAGYVSNVNDTAEYYLIRNAGHGCSLEQPEAVWDAIKNFLICGNDE